MRYLQRATQKSRYLEATKNRDLDLSNNNNIPGQITIFDLASN